MVRGTDCVARTMSKIHQDDACNICKPASFLYEEIININNGNISSLNCSRQVYFLEKKILITF